MCANQFLNEVQITIVNQSPHETQTNNTNQFSNADQGRIVNNSSYEIQNDCAKSNVVKTAFNDGYVQQNKFWT